MVRFFATRSRRRAKIKAKVGGTAMRPRLSAFRSNKYIYAQLIDDKRGRTLLAANSRGFKAGGESGKMPAGQKEKRLTKTEQARLIGKAVAEKARKAGIKKIVFDRSGYKYHGRVKALAQGAREEGLEF